MSHATDVYGGAFSFLMGHQSRAPSDEELARIDDMVSAQDALDGVLCHAARTQCQPDEAGPVLSEIINAWRCLQRARNAAG